MVTEMVPEKSVEGVDGPAIDALAMPGVKDPVASLIVTVKDVPELNVLLPASAVKATERVVPAHTPLEPDGVIVYVPIDWAWLAAVKKQTSNKGNSFCAGLNRENLTLRKCR